MTGHIHTDAMAVLFAGLSAVLVLHLMRMIGASLSARGVGVGQVIGGLATFN
jgi:hypothetical protein